MSLNPGRHASHRWGSSTPLRTRGSGASPRRRGACRPSRATRPPETARQEAARRAFGATDSVSPSRSSRSDRIPAAYRPSLCPGASYARRRPSSAGAFGREPHGDYGAVAPAKADRLRRDRRADGDAGVSQPSLPAPRVCPRLEERRHRHVERPGFARFITAVESLTDGTPPFDALVADGHRLRPPVADFEFPAHERGDLAVPHLRGAKTVEHRHPALPGAAGVLLDRSIAESGECGVVLRGGCGTARAMVGTGLLRIRRGRLYRPRPFSTCGRVPGV